MLLRKVFFCLFLLCLFLVSPVFAELEFSDANVNFGVITRPKSKVVELGVINVSQSPFLGRISAGQPWVKVLKGDLTLSPGQSAEVKFEIDSANLPPGDYKCTITFSAHMSATSNSLPAFATVIQGKDDPVLKVDSKGFDFGEVERGSNPLEKFGIENLGSGILSVEIKYPDWLLCEDQAELRAGQKRPIYIRAMTRELLPDTYKNEITFKSNGGEYVFPVSIKVIPKSDDPILAYSPAEINMGSVPKGRRARAKFKILNKGKKPFNADLLYPEFVVDGIEELKEVSKDREILLVVDTKNLPLGLTRDIIRVTSEYGILDIPFKVFVKK